MKIPNNDDEEIVVTTGKLKAFEAAVRRREKAEFDCTRRQLEITQAQIALENAQIENSSAIDALIEMTDALYGRDKVQNIGKK